MNSRAKGKRAEREVAAILQAWWRQLEPEALFGSTPQSGGWSTPKMRAEFRMAADITTTARLFPFAPEIKRREGWSARNFVEGKASPVWGWWAQAVREAREAKAEPMLWVRRTPEVQRDERGRILKSPPQWIVLVRREALRCWDWLMIPLLTWDEPPTDPAPVGFLHDRLLLVPPSVFTVTTQWWRSPGKE